MHNVGSPIFNSQCGIRNSGSPFDNGLTFFIRCRFVRLLHAGLTPLGRSDIKELAEVTFCLIANIQCVNRYIDRHCFCVPKLFCDDKFE